MNFDYVGYDLKYIQTDRCRDYTAHVCTHIYKFFASKTKLFFILRAEEYESDLYSIKFYCKRHRKSDRKYNKVINKYDLGNTLITCLKIIPIILDKNPRASFSMVGAPTIDEHNRSEIYKSTQRFRIYSKIAKIKITNSVFYHIQAPLTSGYLLLNKTHSKPDIMVGEYMNLVRSIYPNILF